MLNAVAEVVKVMLGVVFVCGVGEDESVPVNVSPDTVPVAPGVPERHPVEVLNVAHAGRVPVWE